MFVAIYCVFVAVGRMGINKRSNGEASQVCEGALAHLSWALGLGWILNGEAASHSQVHQAITIPHTH